jgi:hypothetical protein
MLGKLEVNDVGVWTVGVEVEVGMEEEWKWSGKWE